MELAPLVADFKPPPHPKGISLDGKLVQLVPMKAEEHAEALFEANQLDTEGTNWAYLPYGPFADLKSYHSWVRENQGLEDPVYLANEEKLSGRPLGIASYLRIHSAEGSIEVGHIHFSPLLHRSTSATESMFLMMQWAFEAGYRRYEWKCNALNQASRRAAQRLGFSFEGISWQMMIVKGRNRDTAWFAAIDREWPALKTAFECYLDEKNFDEEGKPVISLSSLTAPLLHKKDV